MSKDYHLSNWVELRFFRNQKMMRIPADQKTALEFVRLCNSNVGNPDLGVNFPVAFTSIFSLKSFKVFNSVIFCHR